MNSTTSKNDTNEMPKYKARAPPNEFLNSAQLISGDSTMFSILRVAKYTLTLNNEIYENLNMIEIRFFKREVLVFLK